MKRDAFPLPAILPFFLPLASGWIVLFLALLAWAVALGIVGLR